jgi:hypothetical protein
MCWRAWDRFCMSCEGFSSDVVLRPRGVPVGSSRLWAFLNVTKQAYINDLHVECIPAGVRN